MIRSFGQLEGWYLKFNLKLDMTYTSVAVVCDDLEAKCIDDPHDKSLCG